MNKTRQDAYERVVQARTGCLAGAPTYEYLVALVYFIREWAGEIEGERLRLALLEAERVMKGD